MWKPFATLLIWYPHRSVGAGRARGAACSTACYSRKNLLAQNIVMSCGSARGGLYFACRERGWGCRATGESVLKVDFGWIFGFVLPALPCRLAFWRRFWFLIVFCIYSVAPRGPLGRAFWRYSLGLFLSMPREHGLKWSHIAFNTAPKSLKLAPKSPKLAPRWHQRGHQIAVLWPQIEPA